MNIRAKQQLTIGHCRPGLILHYYENETERESSQYFCFVLLVM